jgi:hypothetical protein
MDDIELDQYHWHEAWDRVQVCLESFEKFVVGHPTIRQTPALETKANEILDALAYLYQAISDRTPNN